MALAATKYEHIARDDRGVPVIVGANTKVVELISEVHAYGWSPAELHFQHPHLTMAQIYSALAFYWDHREEIDADRRRRFAEVETLRAEAGSSSVVEKLRSLGLLRSFT